MKPLNINEEPRFGDIVILSTDSQEYNEFAQKGWRTYEIYVDGYAMMFFQKWLH